MITYDSSLKIFSSSLIGDERFLSGFSTKELGDGIKKETITGFLKDNEINYSQLVILNQIHSTNILIIDKNIQDKLIRLEDTDGVITNKTKTVLTTRTADCLPIIYCDKENGLIAISHQGWRGSLKKMAKKMINEMIKKGANKEKIIVAIGPGINQCCYDINDDRYHQFLEEFDGYSDKVLQMRHGKRYLNLTLLNYLQLMEAGIDKNNIDYFPFCTRCDQQRFFSFRRDKKKEFGELFSFVIRYTDRL